MGSVVSRKTKRTQRDVNEATSRAIFFGCYGKRCGGSAFESSQMLTVPKSVVPFNNDDTSRMVIRLMEKKIADDTVLENSSLSGETYSSEEEAWPIENMVFSSLCYSQNLLTPPLSRTASTNSTRTYQSFEPTPLTQVLPQLYLGTENDAEQAEKLIGLGITHIISIVGGGRYKDFYPKHMYIPLRDNGSSDLLEKLQNSYDFTLESQEHGNKLFVHCQLGQNRSASFVIGFLMKSRNLSLYEAYSLLKKKRKLIHPHKNYIQQLRQLDLKLHKVYSTPENFLDIAFCSKEEIKVLHHNFSQADSEAFKRSQGFTRRLQDFGDSQSTIRLPDCEDSQSIPMGE